MRARNAVQLCRVPGRQTRARATPGPDVPLQPTTPPAWVGERPGGPLLADATPRHSAERA